MQTSNLTDYRRRKLTRLGRLSGKPLLGRRGGSDSPNSDRTKGRPKLGSLSHTGATLGMHNASRLRGPVAIEIFVKRCEGHEMW